MQLTKHTDYGLRALVYLALHAERRISTREIAEAFGVPHSHLTKVVSRLAAHRYVHTVRGKSGGSTLASAPGDIRIGEVVRDLEDDLSMINCTRPLCPAVRACNLRDIVQEALVAFLGVLNNYTLEDVVENRSRDLQSLLNRLDTTE